MSETKNAKRLTGGIIAIIALAVCLCIKQLFHSPLMGCNRWLLIFQPRLVDFSSLF